MGGLFLLGATGTSLAIPWTVKHAIDALEVDAAAAPIGWYASVILVLAGANGIARLASRFAMIGGAQRIEYDLRNDLYASFQSFPPGFYASRPIGDLMARASSDISAVKSVVGFGAVSFASTIFAFVGALSAMVSVDPRLTLAAMAPYPILVAVVGWFTRRLQERTQAAQEQLGDVSARVQEHLAGMAVVRAYTLEAHAGARFEAANRELLRRSLLLGRLQAQFWPLTSVITGIGTLVVLWLGGTDVVQGRLTLGALVAFTGYLGYLAWPTLALGWTVAMVGRGLTSMARIQEILTVATPVERPGAPLAEPPALRFEHLTFAYEGRDPVLHDVSFTVEAGETVAVVGQTGSGKSTLGLLLARLWEPPPGTVFLGDRDVTALPRAALRASIGYVPQEGFLFSRSIEDNVTLGREEVGAEGARRAARAAGVADEVERFGAGWATVVGERGLTLSGGQRQRVALARALAGDPPALVLDDVFASVDTAKEEEIIENLARVGRGRTVLLMTHRLRAARVADRVLVLAGGRIVETGSHEALLARGGVYAELWRIQQLEEEIARA